MGLNFELEGIRKEGRKEGGGGRLRLWRGGGSCRDPHAVCMGIRYLLYHIHIHIVTFHMFVWPSLLLSHPFPALPFSICHLSILHSPPRLDGQNVFIPTTTGIPNEDPSLQWPIVTRCTLHMYVLPKKRAEVFNSYRLRTYPEIPTTLWPIGSTRLGG